MTDKQYEKYLAKIDRFKRDLRKLGAKYKLDAHSADQYDGRDEYCGTEYYFSFDDEIYYGETIDQLFYNILKK